MESKIVFFRGSNVAGEFWETFPFHSALVWLVSYNDPCNTKKGEANSGEEAAPRWQKGLKKKGNVSTTRKVSTTTSGW